MQGGERREVTNVRKKKPAVSGSPVSFLPILQNFVYISVYHGDILDVQLLRN